MHKRQELDPVLKDIIHGEVIDFVTSMVKGLQAATIQGTLTNRRPPAKARLCTIGFAGKNLRGALAFSANKDFLLRTDPLGRRRLTDQDQREWLEELANRLIGRVKTHFVMHHAPFKTSPPVIISGQDWLANDAGQWSEMQLSIKAAKVTCRVYFRLDVDPPIDFAQSPDTETIIGQAGNHFLF